MRLIIGILLLCLTSCASFTYQEITTLCRKSHITVGGVMILELVRLEESDQGTLGVLKINKEVFGYTLEPPDNLNKSNISSIPTGQYVVKPYSSAKYPATWEVTGVPDRSYILFHAGNTVDHTAGCILLGDKAKKMKGNRAVLNSGNTFQEFLELMDGQDKLHLTITEKYG